MSKFQEMKRLAAENAAKSGAKGQVERGAHIKLNANQVRQAMAGEGQAQLTLHVESARQDAFSGHYGDIVVEVEGLSPVTLVKGDSHNVWAAHQSDEAGFESLFNALFTGEFNGKVEEFISTFPGGEDEDEATRRARKKAGRKIRSVLPAKISFDEPQPVEE